MWFVGVAAAVLAGLGWLERRRPLRVEVDPGPRRLARNATLSLATAAVAALVDAPVTGALARRADAHGRGALQRLPRGLRTLVALLVLDYALYLWHVALHRMPVLWRSHVVHHSDLDLDTSTALRFHASEIAASVLWRAALVRALGIGARPLTLYQQALFLAVVFHHSNVRLPLAVERWLVRVVVTPRMHGIHHSIERAETDSNWSSLLNVWDRLHGTLRLDVPQDEVTIGVPGYRRPLSLPELVALPLEPVDVSWQDAPPPRAPSAPAVLPPERSRP
jgi:sterol desaturase/sphingolipid hydroxylase (fatty acid hydroxylase superfamily)